MKRKDIFCVVIVAMLMIFGIGAASAQTPTQALEKCAAKLRNASSLTATYQLTTSGRTVSGTLYTKGSKFAMEAPGAGTWYDGRDIWTYSKASGEATVWRPTAGELAESNPLLFLSTLKDYVVKESGKATQTSRTYTLTPRKRNAGVKSVSVTINPTTSLPTSFRITAGGGSYSVAIKSVKLNTQIADATFKFNKGKYPGVSVTDLR